MMHIHLNHELMTRRVNVFSITLLVIGSLLAVALFFYCQQLASQTELLRFDMQQRTQPAVKPYSQSLNSRALQQISSKEDAEITAVNAAIKEIVLPWHVLFKTLESTNREEVKLLTLEPNAKAPNAQQRTLRITAVALDTSSMMSYVDELTQQRMLKNVVLLSQESTEISGQNAIRFVVEAVWKI